MYSSMCSIWRLASDARLRPSCSSCSMRSSRDRTSAYSAATKKPLSAIISGTTTSRRTRFISLVPPGGGRYFEEVRRQSFGERLHRSRGPGGRAGRRAQGPDPRPQTPDPRPQALGTRHYPLADDLVRRAGLEPGRRRWEPVIGCPIHEALRCTLGDSGDGQRWVDAQGGRDRRAVDAEEALVVERLAAVVHHAEVLGVGHSAAAERVGAVSAARLGELEEAREAAPLDDRLHRRVGRLAHTMRLVGKRVLEQ